MDKSLKKIYLISNMYTWGRSGYGSDYITPDPPQISLEIDQCLPSKKDVRAKKYLSTEYLLYRGQSERLTGFLLLKSIFSPPPHPPTSLHCPRVTNRVEMKRTQWSFSIKEKKKKFHFPPILIWKHLYFRTVTFLINFKNNYYFKNYIAQSNFSSYFHI